MTRLGRLEEWGRYEPTGEGKNTFKVLNLLDFNVIKMLRLSGKPFGRKTSSVLCV